MFWVSGGSDPDFMVGFGICATHGAEWAGRGLRGARTFYRMPPCLNSGELCMLEDWIGIMFETHAFDW
eukprot:5088420-Alexandrium_andersonii.AAC.1